MKDDTSKVKTFLLGALIGGTVGAVTALLFAPKSGRELRRDIVDSTTDMYDKANDLIQEAKQKTNNIVDSVKRQADSFLHKVGDYYEDANGQISTSTESVQQRFESLKDAARTGADAFKTELKK
ncbi:MAG: YtxH domain-containing protein [Bacteroidetes bacterium]|nr:YtxH domain-containing protein [Bacteroidota bacterium]